MKYIFWGLMIFSVKGLSSQNSLTLESAINTALETNYGIRLAVYEKQIAELQNSAGYAGMLPTISATATYNTELSNSEQQYFNGESKSASNAGSTLFDGGIYLNYVVFDGLGMFATKEKFEQLALMSDFELRRDIEETVFSISMNWYQLVQLQYAREVMDSAITVSNQRWQIAKSKESLGAGSGLDILQALVDLNADSSALINLDLQIANAKTEINRLMGREPSTQFSISDTIIIDKSISLVQLQTAASEKNIDVVIAMQDEKITELEIKEFKSYLYPTLTLNGGYGYLKSTSEAGFVESNLSYGPSAGFTIDIPLFSGFTVKRNLDIAEINRQMGSTTTEQARLDVSAYLLSLWNQYNTSIYLIALEQKNVEAARQNVAIALEKFNAGTITSVDLREIQQTQIEAENRLLLETLNAKLAELQLKKLAGNLVPN